MISFLFHEIRYNTRASGGPGAALAVFLLALIIFPLLLGPETDLLARIGPGLVWLMCGLASLLYAPVLIQEDLNDGSLTQMLLTPMSPIFIFIGNTITHFILVGVPILLVCSLSSPIFGLSHDQAYTLAFSLLLGLPAISGLSLLGSALAAGAQGGPLITLLVILPFMIPLFLFGLSAVDATGLGLSPRPHLLLLSGSSLIGLIISVFAGQSLLREQAYLN